MQFHFFLATAQPKPPLLPANNVHDDSLASTLDTSASADKKSEVVGGQDGLVSMDTSLNSQSKDTLQSVHPDSINKEKRKKKKHKQHKGL